VIGIVVKDEGVSEMRGAVLKQAFEDFYQQQTSM
jgi:hypothetical protein